MKYRDKISVIIPTYNRESTIKASIESVLGQTYDNIEVIVVDDGSTDNTEKVVKSIKDKRLKYIKQKKNAGACMARNIGIEKATGTYISFQDSDDIYYKNKLEKQFQNMQKENSDFDFCKLTIHDGSIKIMIPTKEQIESIKEDKIIEELCHGNFISTQAILVKTSKIKETNFDISLPRLQDYDLCLRIIPKCKVSFTNANLVNLYSQKDSIGNNNDKLKFAIAIIINKKYEITEGQEKQLNQSLNDLYVNRIQNKYERTINEIGEKYEKQINELNSELNFYKDEFYKVINSRTWRLKTKINNVLKRN